METIGIVSFLNNPNDTKHCVIHSHLKHSDVDDRRASSSSFINMNFKIGF